MYTKRWITFGSFCLLSFLVGVNYLFMYPKVKSIVPMYEDFYEDMYEYLYPLLYVILGPICFKLIWKSFYWSCILGWICVLSYASLSYLKLEDSFSGPISRVLLIFSSSLLLPGTGVLAVKFFDPNEYFFILTFSSLSNLVGTVFGQVLDYILDPEILLMNQVILCVIGLILFTIGAEKDPQNEGESFGFFEAIKILFTNQENGILFLTICAQIGIIFCSTTEFFNLYYLLFKGNYEVAYFYLTLFGILSIIGGFLNLFILKKMESFGVMIRLYLGISFLLLFLLNFIFKGPVFYMIMCVVTGLTTIPSLSLMQIIILGSQKSLSQPISINLSLYFGSFFMVLFLLMSKTLYYYEIRSTWGYNAIQLLILTSFLSVYEHGIEKRFLRKSL